MKFPDLNDFSTIYDNYTRALAIVTRSVNQFPPSTYAWSKGWRIYDAIKAAQYTEAAEYFREPPNPQRAAPPLPLPSLPHLSIPVNRLAPDKRICAICGQNMDPAKGYWLRKGHRVCSLTCASKVLGVQSEQAIKGRSVNE